MKRAIGAGCVAAGCVGAVIYANSKPADFSDQFITLPSGYQAYCNEQGYREIRYYGRPQLVTDPQGNFVECDARVGPPGSERTDEQRALGEKQRAEKARLDKEHTDQLRSDRVSAQLKDRLAQCQLKNSSIFDWPEIHQGPIPENPDAWRALQEKCRLQARAWYEEEMKADPHGMPLRSATLSFYPQKWWQSVSDTGQVSTHEMDNAENLRYSVNENTGELTYPAEK
jgi:hypothetical protein